MASEANDLAADPAGITEVGGVPYMHDARGHLVPVANIKAEDKLEDELVRKIIGFAEALSAQITRFRDHTMADIAAFDGLLAQQYGSKVGGAKGNKTYQTFDGLLKVQVQVATQIAFGPQLQTAKALIDECLNEWSEGSRPEIKSIVTRAFNTDQEGKINKSELFMLLRLEIDDDRWNRAMDAIRTSIRPIGSKEYVRFYRRDGLDENWQAITIDLAKA